MKIGIISEFLLHTVNYGNQLQAYALNTYLRNYCGMEQVTSIALGTQVGKHIPRCSWAFAKKIYKALKGKFLGYTSPIADCSVELLQDRYENFRRFRTKNIPSSETLIDGRELEQSDYDVLLVGSDVVWAQIPFWVSRTKFLDFSGLKPIKRISYAASFGRDYIPKENIQYIRKYLSAFDAISVRERSSVEMLHGIGVSNVSYCLDPTLLLTKQEWEPLEFRPEQIEEGQEYVFVYLLGKDARQRQAIASWASECGLKLVTVPYASGNVGDVDESFAEGIMDCSIENWIWLIHHAQYIVTDSFHGTVFSTIFQKNFVVLKRVLEIDINNRLQDYLREIGQEDKSISADSFDIVTSLNWDYEQINKKIAIRRQDSISFLKKALGV